MASSSSHDMCLGFSPSYMAQTLPVLINDLRTFESDDEVKLSILNDCLVMCQAKLFLAAGYKQTLPHYFTVLLNGMELLKDEMERIEEAMEPTVLATDKNNNSKNEEQSGNPTHGHDKIQERHQAANAALKIISTMLDIKRRPLTEPIMKNARILWTSELHGRFVATLNLLGGPEVAKPTQIRESMKVEELTTEQVKSYLQNYRQTWRSERRDAAADE